MYTHPTAFGSPALERFIGKILYGFAKSAVPQFETIPTQAGEFTAVTAWVSHSPVNAGMGKPPGTFERRSRPDQNSG